jgi:dTDP-4-amino-4,6-dideoxygalactose transaminase
MRSEYLPYCRPSIGPLEIAAATAAMESGWLTTGPNVRRFEEAFAGLLGAKHAVALNSCTAGLHLSLVALGIGPGDEVIVPSLNFVASAQCVREVGATPVFCDVNADTLSLDASCVEAVITANTRAVMPMHYAGHPAGMDAIADLARKRGLLVIEDAALAMGTLDRGSQPGARSDVTLFSFYATKNICTGEGGMAITDDAELADKIRMLSLHGMNRDAWKRYLRGGSWRYDVTVPGFKYNLTDLAAAIGLVQIQRFDTMQARRAELAERFIEGLRGLPGIEPVATALGPGDRHSWCVFPVTIEDDARVTRDALIEQLAKANIGTSVHYIPTHTFAAYRHLSRGPLPVTESAWPKLLSLPLFPSMSDTDVDDVLSALSEALSKSAGAA